jgi:hypothetical protein
MNHYAGLDVSLEETSICVVDGAGLIVKEVRAASEPETASPAHHNHISGKDGEQEQLDLNAPNQRSLLPKLRAPRRGVPRR